MGIIVFSEWCDRHADHWDLYNIAGDAGHQAIIRDINFGASQHDPADKVIYL
jgi:hypothetical protein